MCDCARKSNIAIMQRCQSKILRIISNAIWYVSNHTLHIDLGVCYAQDIIIYTSRNNTNIWIQESPLLRQPLAREDAKDDGLT